MEIEFIRAPNQYSDWDLTRIFAKILHSEDFAPRTEDERVINFQVKLKPNPAGGVRSNGTGVLTVPSETTGHKLLEYLYNNPITIDKKKLKFFKKGIPYKGLALTLEKTPYVNPDIEEERQKKLRALEAKLRVDCVQFGVFYRPTYPSNEKEPLRAREFSIEWEGNYAKHSIGWLGFDYDHKLIRITLGSELTEETGSSLAINFSTIQKIGIGHDGKPYICFETLTPPVMERIDFHRPMTGDKEKDNKKFKKRIGSLHEGHSVVAPYAHQLRVVLFHDPNSDTIQVFMDMCLTAGIARSTILQCEGNNQIEAFANGFFNPRRLYNLHGKLAKFKWPVAFQLESLLHNGLLHTGDIEELLPRIEELCQNHSQRRACFVGDLLRRYNEVLQVRTPRESPLRCLERVLEGFEYSESDGFRCCHVTVTPTRMILEGPYATQSNRVIREYEGYEDHFIRVDFRDEDRLRYRWDREVDGASFVRQRVGTTLKQGFVLAGRRFEFLAYSSSALREHAVWFMNPFDLPGDRRITADSIRRSVGNFEGTKLLRHPSKYAARMAQAFTATDPSVKIRRNEWEVVPDLGSDPYFFTDGVGTISQKLADRIHEKLTKDRPDTPMKPSAYQIRFLGFKGVVAVDPLLDKHPKGIQMRLRESMKKFDTMDEDDAPIEIAQAFEHPNPCYLNRPLVMLLEDVGVRKESFQYLQDLAVEKARTIDDSISRFNDILASHNLGSGYRLRKIMGRLQDRYNMDLKSDGRRIIPMDNPFFSQLRQVAMNDILRNIKHGARIPVPDSYLLVGVADEGPAYEAAGYTNIFKLEESQIYACIQKAHDLEPTWLEGNVSISRSPVAHPGDVQRVRAVGKPPPGMLCLFSHLKNVVVLPSVGSRSLASCLGGGDVDGDMFSVICHDPLLPTTFEAAAKYESCGTYEIDRDSTVEDICDFVVEYINSDVLGLLSDRLLVIAGVYHSQGLHDPECIMLAELCSHAVDYPKQGIPVDLDDNKLPRALIRCKPDWHAAEVVSPRQTDYYESSRALGLLYRSITLGDPQPIPPVLPVQPLSDPITLTLLESVQCHLGESAIVNNHPSELQKLFRRYADELRYICATHTLSDAPGVRLLEAEVVVGTILAKCSQKRWRTDRIYRMRLHASALVKHVRRNLIESMNGTVSELIAGLQLAWSAWDLSLRRRNEFGANSFGLIALDRVFDCLDEIELREG
ncbi:RdRP-domain-containing protein [Phlegmacium glaucopus]|nr:RdRP-domain-containing protein [Phlegmacium glaucopus]